MIEPECAFADLNDNMDLAEAMLKYVIRYVLENAPEEMNFFNSFVDKGLLDRLNHVINSEFGHVTYTEAVELLEKNNDKFDYKVFWGCDLQTEHERYLTEEIFKKPVFVTDYPKEIKSFYMKQNDDGKTVRANVVNQKLSKGFHEKLLKFAQSIGMGGLGYLEVLEDGAYKGPIDKFIPDDMKDEIRELAGLKALDTIFFIADNEKNASLYAGQIRTALGERLDLIEKNKFMFCYINDFPMYEYDNETKKMIFTHNPFSMPQGGLEALETKNPEEILAYQYDIVCNGVELSSGAVRNHDMKIMVKAFEIAGYTEEDLKEKFGALYNAFQFGAPPHAGMAPGVDRMIMLLRDEENIREVIPFPMNGNAQDLMCGAPGEVTEQQLRETHIKVRA